MEVLLPFTTRLGSILRTLKKKKKKKKNEEEGEEEEEIAGDGNAS